MNRVEELKMTHSGILTKKGKRQVCVRFERGSDMAEADLPACKVTKSQGFTAEEIAGLEEYLAAQNDIIFEKAKAISSIRHWL